MGRGLQSPGSSRARAPERRSGRPGVRPCSSVGGLFPLMTLGLISFLVPLSVLRTLLFERDVCRADQSDEPRRPVEPSFVHLANLRLPSLFLGSTLIPSPPHVASPRDIDPRGFAQTRPPRFRAETSCPVGRCAVSANLRPLTSAGSNDEASPWGIPLVRCFTRAGTDPLDEIVHDCRDRLISDLDSSVVAVMRGMRGSASWSCLATDIAASKSLRKA